jgi:hypothetical protein
MTSSTDHQLSNHFGDNYQGLPLTLQSLGAQQWLVVLAVAPPCRLRLSAESDLTKQVDSMGFSDENKVGEPSLDDAFVIRAETSEAQALLQDANVVQLLQKLAPFVELELTHKEYRLIKDGLDGSVASLEPVLQTLAELVRASQAQ